MRLDKCSEVSDATSLSAKVFSNDFLTCEINSGTSSEFPALIAFSVQELSKADVAIKGAEADPLYALERSVVAIASKVGAR